MPVSIVVLVGLATLMANGGFTLQVQDVELRRAKEARLEARVQVGGILRVSTPVALTSGYRWIGTIGRGSPLRLEGSEVLDGGSALLGAPATFRARYRILRAGCARLDFRMVRRGTLDEVPEDRFVVVVTASAPRRKKQKACAPLGAALESFCVNGAMRHRRFS